MSNRRGFAMITILWVIVSASFVAAVAALAGRTIINATRNRAQLERAYWIATGCAAQARAAIDDRLRAAITYDDAARLWRVLHRSMPSIPTPAGESCRIDLVAAGTKLDVNAASAEMLDTVLSFAGVSSDAAASMAAEVVRWREEHDPFVDVRELRRFAGFDPAVLSALDSLVWAEPGRVSLATAGVAVLRSIPGITRETAEQIVALSDAGTPVSDPLAVAGSLSHLSADLLIAHYADIVRLTTADPEAWLLIVRGGAGLPESVVTLEWRLVRAGKRCTVVRTRSTV